MTPDLLEAIFTDATCGEACWTAKEDVCRCSCGGKNHGCLRTANGVQPVRQCKIDGVRFELKAVSGPDADLEAKAKEINVGAGIMSCLKTPLANYYGSSTSRDPMFRALPAKVRPATAVQLANWPELKSERERIAKIPDGLWQSREWGNRSAYLLWVRADYEVKA